MKLDPTNGKDEAIAVLLSICCYWRDADNTGLRFDPEDFEYLIQAAEAILERIDE
jgi:hypothetical protein